MSNSGWEQHLKANPTVVLQREGGQSWLGSQALTNEQGKSPECTPMRAQVHPWSRWLRCAPSPPLWGTDACAQPVPWLFQCARVCVCVCVCASPHFPEASCMLKNGHCSVLHLLLLKLRGVCKKKID